MKLKEFNIIINETAFAIISKELKQHINKLEHDASEFNLGVVKLMVGKTNKILDDLEFDLENNRVLRDLDSHIESATKQLTFFRTKFENFIELWKSSDFDFEKKIINDATNILIKLNKRIENVLSSTEEKMKTIIQNISKEVQQEVKQKQSRKKVTHIKQIKRYQ